jgi:predicted RNase H-like nuclease (RuvC/YqgF family)
MAAVTDLFLAHLAETIKNVREHEHPGRGEDLYCLNLLSWMGERMGPVLERVKAEQAEVERWKAKHTALAEEAAGYRDRIAELEADLEEIEQERAGL